MTPMNTKRLSRNVLAVALAIAACALAVPPLAGQSQEPVDLQAIYRIKEEGLQRSKVMEITSYLTDVYGPRLTGSPNIRTAGEWAVKELQSWGLANAKLEPWGPFGRGWSNELFAGRIKRFGNAVTEQEQRVARVQRDLGDPVGHISVDPQRDPGACECRFFAVGTQ